MISLDIRPEKGMNKTGVTYGAIFEHSHGETLQHESP
jgi:hypothetical protein